MSDNTTTAKPRPLGVVHLVFGLVFTGIAAIWLIGAANDSDTSDLAAGVPVVLIGAGIVGLAAVLVNQRRAKAQLATDNTGHTEALLVEDADEVAPAEPTTQVTDDVADTTVITPEKDPS